MILEDYFFREDTRVDRLVKRLLQYRSGLVNGLNLRVGTGLLFYLLCHVPCSVPVMWLALLSVLGEERLRRELRSEWI